MADLVRTDEEEGTMAEKTEGRAMRRATVVCAMDPLDIGLATPVETEGYACEIHGLPMVVHRVLRADDDGWRRHSRHWAVTEPTTGRAVASSTSRRDAITLAEEEVWQHGGPDAVRREIEKHEPITDPVEAPDAR